MTYKKTWVEQRAFISNKFYQTSCGIKEFFEREVRKGGNKK